MYVASSYSNHLLVQYIDISSSIPLAAASIYSRNFTVAIPTYTSYPHSPTLSVVLLYRFAGIQLSTANLRTTEYYLTYLRMTGHLVSSVFTHSSVCIIDIAIDSQ